ALAEQAAQKISYSCDSCLTASECLPTIREGSTPAGPSDLTRRIDLGYATLVRETETAPAGPGVETGVVSWSDVQREVEVCWPSLLGLLVGLNLIPGFH